MLILFSLRRWDFTTTQVVCDICHLYFVGREPPPPNEANHIHTIMIFTRGMVARGGASVHQDLGPQPYGVLMDSLVQWVLGYRRQMVYYIGFLITSQSSQFTTHTGALHDGTT